MQLSIHQVYLYFRTLKGILFIFTLKVLANKIVGGIFAFL